MNNEIKNCATCADYMDFVFFCAARKRFIMLEEDFYANCEKYIPLEAGKLEYNGERNTE